MSTLLLLTSALQPSAEVLPGLALLGHQVKILPAEGSALLEAPDSDLLLVDGRQDAPTTAITDKWLPALAEHAPEIVLLVDASGVAP